MRSYRSDRIDVKTRLRSRIREPKLVHRDKRCFDVSEEEFLRKVGPSDEGLLSLHQLLEIVEILENNLHFAQSEQIFTAISARFIQESPLSNDDYRVRAASMRVLSLASSSERLIITLFKCNADVILLRSLYLPELHEIERGEALCLTARVFSILVKSKCRLFLTRWWRFQIFAKNALFCLIQIVQTGYVANDLKRAHLTTAEGQDRRGREEKFACCAIYILMEIGVHFPRLFYDLGIGSRWLVQLVHKSFEDLTQPFSGLVLQIISGWLDNPEVRRQGELHLVLQQLFAPLLEIGFFQQHLTKESTVPTQDESNKILDSCSHCLVRLLHTWPGLLSCLVFSEDNPQTLDPGSCLKLLDHLGRNSFSTPNMEHLRKCIVGLFCEFFSLPYANKKFENWAEAVHTYTKISLPDSYRSSLRGDFVLAEIPFVPYTTNRVDLLEVFRAVGLYGFVNAGLVEALIRLILQNPDGPGSINATLLLADIMLKSAVHLPREWRLKTLGISELINQAVQAFQLKPFRELRTEQLNCGDMNWELTKNENHRNAILLLDRLDLIIGFHRQPKTASDQHFVKTFLVADYYGVNRRRESATESRHSSTSGDCAGTELVDSRAGGREDCAASVFANLDELMLSAFTVDQQPQTPVAGGQTPQTPSSLFNITGVGVGVPILPMRSTHQKNVSEQELTRPVWRVIWQILQMLDEALAQQKPTVAKLLDKCVPLFNQLVHHLLPSNQKLLHSETEPLLVICAQMCFHLLNLCSVSSALVGSDNSRWAAQQIANFLLDFSAQFRDSDDYGVFSSKNLLNKGSCYYFAILRVISSHSAGRKLFEHTSLTQILFDLVANPLTTPELIKLIISSLDYFPIDEVYDSAQPRGQTVFAKGLLETVLQSNSEEATRKWATRFLDALFTLNLSGDLPSFDWSWILKIAFRQLSDPSLKVVRNVAELLLKWMPHCPEENRKEVLELLRRSKLEILGDLGRLLEVFLFGDWNEGLLWENPDYVESVFVEWKNSFNLRYVHIVEEKMRRAVLPNGGSIASFQHKRSLDGNFARASNQRLHGKQSNLYCPTHLYGQLARTEFGLQFLLTNRVVEDLMSTLYTFLSNNTHCPDDIEVKSVLLALAQILANSPSDFHWSTYDLTQLIRRVVNQEERSEISLAIRGYAIWAMNIAASGNQNVAKLIAGFGWECGEANEVIPLMDRAKNHLPIGKLPATEPISGNRQSRCSEDNGNENMARNNLNSVKMRQRRAYSELGRGKADLIITDFEEVGGIAPVMQRQFRSASLLDFAPSRSKQSGIAQKIFDELRFAERLQLTFDRKRPNSQHSAEDTMRRSSTVSSDAARRSRFSTLDNAYYTRNEQSEVGLVRSAKSYEDKIKGVALTSTSSDDKVGGDEEKSCTRQRLMTDQEHTALIAYRKFLVKAGEINEYDEIEIASKISERNVICIDKNSNGIFLPLRMQSIFLQNGFTRTGKEQTLKETMSEMRTHNKWYCLYCRGTQGKSAKVDEECELAYKRVRGEIINLLDKTLNQMKNSETLVKLLHLYKNEQKAFQHPCLLSDALHIQANSKANNFESRRLVFQLFWDCKT